MNIINLMAANIPTSSIVLYVVLALMVIAMLVFPTISRRRQMKDFAQMMDNLSVGDQIMTNTGMIGTIKKINRKADGMTFLLETGEKTVIEFDVGAISRVLHSVKPIPVATKSKDDKKIKAEVVSQNSETEKTEDKKEEKVVENTDTAKKEKKPQVANIKKSSK